MAVQVILPAVIPFVLGTQLANDADLTVTVGAPHTQPPFTVRAAETRWAVGAPELAWTVLPPVMDR